MPDRPLTGAAGQVSLKHVAAHLGLSHTTVSRALNGNTIISDATTARVREAAATLGYVTNTAGRLLRGMPGRLVGLIIPDVQNDFYSTVAKVLAERCAAQGLQMILAISEDDSELEARHVLSLIEARVAGVVITPTIHLTARSAELLGMVPAVQLVRSHASLALGRVGIDDHAATWLATRHLLELGHTRIGFIGGGEGLSTAAERFGGYRDALAGSGLVVDLALVARGSPRPEFGQASAQALWSQPDRPTALVMGSSQLTLGALLAFQEIGVSMPGDISLVGYGDPPWFKLMATPVTTVELPVVELSKAALGTLLQRMQQPSGTVADQLTRQDFTPVLIPRRTTGRPRHGHLSRHPVSMGVTPENA